MKVLIAEDDNLLSAAICKIMQNDGFFTDAVFDGEAAVYYALNSQYDLIILDLMMPKLDGMEVISQIRKKGISTPVLILTAKNTIKDKVSGLNIGADDYMTKPFNAEELSARANALTRRKDRIILDEIKFGDVSLNLTNAAICKGDNSVQLTKKEFAVIKHLFLNPKTITSKENIIINVWGADSSTTENNVEAYISFIRKKLKYLNSSVKIRNIQSLGYRLEES